MRNLMNLRQKKLLYVCLFGTAGVWLVVVMVQFFGASAGWGIAEQMGRIGRAEVRAEKLPDGSVVAHDGVPVAMLEEILVLQEPRDSSSGLVYVKGRWHSDTMSSDFRRDTAYVGIVVGRLEADHPWEIRLEKHSLTGLLLIGLMRLYPDSSTFALYKEVNI